MGVSSRGLLHFTVGQDILEGNVRLRPTVNKNDVGLVEAFNEASRMIEPVRTYCNSIRTGPT